MVFEPETRVKTPILSQFRRKAVVNLLRTWRDLAGSARTAISGAVRPNLPKEDRDILIRHMKQCLDTKGGEISARNRTVDLGRIYLGLNDIGKSRFLEILADDFDVESTVIAGAIKNYSKATSDGDRQRREQELRDVLVSPRSKILRQFSALPDGFKFLVDMRADLLPLVSKNLQLGGLEYDMKVILSSWFDIGLLDLEEITWNSPAALLEKLIAYEAVHKIKSWDDLKNRLDSDRRVYAFLHNKMKLEPLIFVQVALVDGMSDNIQALLDESSPVTDTDKADTAIFYSISNAQKGLAGISFGNFLIKRVVDKLSREFKNIKTFATLSPVPGLRAWLDPLLAKGDESIFENDEKKILKILTGKKDNAAMALLELLGGDWHADKKTADAIKPILLRLCARYLLLEKKKDRALDPVAHFHLFNGARLERINWLGDTSAKGFKHSAGLMVNYYYKLGDIDNNHEDYAEAGKIAASKQVRSLIG